MKMYRMKVECKAVFAFILAVSMMTMFTIPCYAVDETARLSKMLEDGTLEKQSERVISREANYIESLSDDEYSEFISELVIGTSKEEYADLQDQLALVNVELSDRTEMVVANELELLPSNFTVSAYHTKRGAYTKYYLGFSVYANRAETRPGTVDVIAFYFDSDKCTYDGYNVVGDTVSLRSVAQKSNGCVLFNYEDASMEANTAGNYGAGAATIYVEPSVHGTWVDYSGELSHTYRITHLDEVGGSASVDFSAVKIDGHVTATVTGKSYEECWTKASANSFKPA